MAIDTGKVGLFVAGFCVMDKIRFTITNSLEVVAGMWGCQPMIVPQSR